MEHLNNAVRGSADSVLIPPAGEVREADFVANEISRLQQLASLIRSSGKTPLEIGRACGLDKRTVIRALKAMPLKSDAQARIEFYLKNLLNHVNKTTTPVESPEG